MWHPCDITQTIPFYATANEDTDIFMSCYVYVMQYCSNGALIRKYVACNVTRFLVSARRGQLHILPLKREYVIQGKRIGCRRPVGWASWRHLKYAT